MENSVKEKIENLINESEVMLFMKGTPEMPQCGFSAAVAVAEAAMACRIGFENVVALICGVGGPRFLALSHRTSTVYVFSTSPSRIVHANTNRAALSWGSLSQCTSPACVRTPWYLRWPSSRENASHDKLLRQSATPALHVDVSPLLSIA